MSNAGAYTAVSGTTSVELNDSFTGLSTDYLYITSSSGFPAGNTLPANSTLIGGIPTEHSGISIGAGGSFSSLPVQIRPVVNLTSGLYNLSFTNESAYWNFTRAVLVSQAGDSSSGTLYLLNATVFPGQWIEVAGWDFPADADIGSLILRIGAIQIPLNLTDIGAGSLAGPSPQNITTDGNGAFRMLAYIPLNATAGSANLTLGNYSAAQISLRISPVLQLSAYNGYPTSGITLTGSYFAPLSNITVWFDSFNIQNFTTNSTGDFSGVIYVPSLPFGTHTIRANDTQGNSSLNLTFNITGVLQPGTVFATEGELITIYGRGLVPSEQYYIYWDGTNTSTSVVANSSGVAFTTFQVPTGPGLHTISLQGGTISIPSVSIQVRAAAAYTNETFFLHNATAAVRMGGISTLRYFDTNFEAAPEKGNSSTRSNKDLYCDWYLFPPLAGDITIYGRITFAIYAIRIGVNVGGTMNFLLYSDNPQNPGTRTLIASATISPIILTDWTEYQIQANVNTPVRVNAGQTLYINFTINGNNANDYAVAWGNATFPSRIIIPLRTHNSPYTLNTLNYNMTPTINFDNLAVNKTYYIESVIADPIGGYDTRFVNYTVLGPSGEVIVPESPLPKLYGYYNTYLSTYRATLNYSLYTPGQYTVVLTTVDNSGWNERYPYNPGDTTYGGHLEVKVINFWIGGAPEVLNLSVLDSRGIPVEGAYVRLGLSWGLTDENGFVSLFGYPGSYQLEIYYEDVSVYNDTLILNESGNQTVHVNIFYPDILILDTEGVPLNTATAYLVHPNGSAIAVPWITGADGLITPGRCAGGIWGISVSWLGVIVFNNTLNINASGLFSINTEVYHLSIVVQDRGGNGIPLAQVVVSNTTTQIVADSKMTNLSGGVLSRLPLGAYDFTVYWKNVVVSSSVKDYLVDSSRTLVITADIYTLTINIVDTSGIPLQYSEVILYTSDMSMLIDTTTLSEYGSGQVPVPAGDFIAVAYWKNIAVNFTPFTMPASDFTLNLTASVFYVPVLVVDSHGAPVEAVHLTFFYMGLSVESITTNSSGLAIARLPEEQYDIIGDYQGINVLSVSGVQCNSSQMITLNAAIYYIKVLTVDSGLVPLSDVLITARTATGQLLYTNSTSTDGTAVLKLPVVDAIFNSTWYSYTVSTTSYKVTGDSIEPPVLINCSVFYVNINCFDSAHIPVQDADVRITSERGDLVGAYTTSENGTAVARLAAASYSLRFVWKNIDVTDEVNATITITQNSTFNFTLKIGYLSIKAVDSKNIPVAEAQALLINTYTGAVFDTKLTNATGEAVFRLAASTYNLTLYWRDTIINTTSIVFTSNASLILNASVYYLRLNIIDAQDKPVEKAELIILRANDTRVFDSQYTALEGWIVSRLPGGIYNIQAYWHNILVNHTVNYTLSTDTNLTLHSSIYYITFIAVDEKSIPLSDAVITIGDVTVHRIYDSEITDNSGRAVVRLPALEYILTVKWDNVEVFNNTGNPYSVSSSTEYTLGCRVFYLTIKVLDSDGEGVEGASVIAYRGNSAVRANLTDAGGNAVMRLPVGNYLIDMSFTTTYYLTHIEVRKNTSADLTASTTVEFRMSGDEYKLPFYKLVLFWIIVILVLLTAIIGFLGYLVFKYRGMAAEKGETKESTDQIPSEKQQVTPETEEATGEEKVAKEGSGKSSEAEEVKEEKVEKEGEEEKGDEQKEEQKEEEKEKETEKEEGAQDESSSKPDEEKQEEKKEEKKEEETPVEDEPPEPQEDEGKK
ncbi:MAG: carboxypeptidase-like regulatory domain-containing protein [Thermoplasmata archaeon]